MSLRTSQPIIWGSVALLTAGLYAGAMTWVKFSIEIPAPPPEKPIRIDLGILQAAPPALETEGEPEPAAEPELEPVVEPEPEPIPEPEPPAPAPPPPPPKADPPPPPKPKIDPAIVKKQREEKAARDREKARQRQLAKERAAKKRRAEAAAKKIRDAAAAKKRAAARKAAAKRAAEKRISKKPVATSRSKPSYPRSSRRAGHQGTVSVRFTVGTSGHVTSIRVTKSSGHAALDRAALSAVRKWRFKPARNGLGKPVPYTYSQSIPFRLK